MLEKLEKGELSAAEMQEVKLLTQDNNGDWTFKQQLMLDMGPKSLLAVTRATVDPIAHPHMDKNDLDFIQTTLARGAVRIQRGPGEEQLRLGEESPAGRP